MQSVGVRNLLCFQHKQIPRFARDDSAFEFFSILLTEVPRIARPVMSGLKPGPPRKEVLKQVPATVGSSAGLLLCTRHRKEHLVEFSCGCGHAVEIHVEN